jgi:multidrug resistance efflux pump
MMLDAIRGVAMIAEVLPACAPPANAAVGFIEGECVDVAPIAVARIAGEWVRRGDRLNAGGRIATLETADADIAVRNAEAVRNASAIDAALAGDVLQLDSSATLRRGKILFRRAFGCDGIWPGSGVACGGGF